MTPMQPGRPTTLSTTSSRLRALCHPSTPQTQPEVLRRLGTRPSLHRLPGLSQTTPRPGRSTTRRWGRRAALCLDRQAEPPEPRRRRRRRPQREASRITAQPGPSTTGSRRRTTGRRDKPLVSPQPLPSRDRRRERMLRSKARTLNSQPGSSRHF